MALHRTPTSFAKAFLLRAALSGRVIDRLLRLPDDDLFEALGIPTGNRKRTSQGARKVVRAQLAALERARARGPDHVERNTRAFGSLIGLSTVETDVLLLALAIEETPDLRTCLGRARPSDRDIVMADIVGHPTSAVEHALRMSGVLHRSGLVRREQHGSSERPLKLLDNVSSLLQRPAVRRDDVLAHFARRSRPTKLTFGDFAHIPELGVLTTLFEGAVKARRSGFHVLLHGAAGTGKTELARVVAEHVGARLFEVPDADEDNDALTQRRLGACALAQRLLGQSRRAALLFDEAEDAFPFEPGPFQLSGQKSTADKSWTHHMLEEASVPMLWTANNVRHVDRATLRRFALVLEVKAMPMAVRSRVLTERLGSAVSPAWVERHARDDRVSPGEIARLETASQLLGREPGNVEAKLDEVLRCNLALSGRPKPVRPPSVVPYDLKYVNASVDLEALVRNLSKPGARGAICLYGPPGTGKTEFVHHVADRLGRPLVSARASDLLDCYVGGTEENIAGLFARAETENAVLFIDEVDSFLQDRRGARATWEVTQVNELLVQIESFPGLLFCATNLVEALDHASMRRFALKIRFGFLTPAQALQVVRTLESGADEHHLQCELRQLRALTLGDLVAAARYRALGNQSSLLDAIRADAYLTAKMRGAASNIGF